MGRRRPSEVNLLLAVDKPVGISSHDVVSRVRRALDERRVGHAGTLDPLASGVMVVGVGQATRLLGRITLARKGYIARIAFGSETNTDDAEGEVVRTAEVKPWDFLNAVSARDMARALELLALQPDRSEVRLWSLLVTRIRELIVAKALDSRGAGRELASTLGVQSWQVRNHLAWARRYRMEELVAALSSAVDVELALKGSRDGALALRLWVIGIIRK